MAARYTPPQPYVFHGQTSTQCGTASNSVGLFYCPPEQGVYIDPDFFQIMRDQFDASAGELAQLYIVGHEWGHHIQNISGTMDAYPNNGTGPDSNSVRTELQADCYAGAWLADAADQKDPDGVPYLEEPTGSPRGIRTVSAAATPSPSMAVDSERFRAASSPLPVSLRPSRYGEMTAIRRPFH